MRRRELRHASVNEVGQLISALATNVDQFVAAQDGSVESPWVDVKDWRCEHAFFAYFLCTGAPKEVPLGDKESRCRPAQQCSQLKQKSHHASLYARW
jgi:hypothetical protein